jgi:tetratricopeptide (TPR) repeat protein
VRAAACGDCDSRAFRPYGRQDSGGLSIVKRTASQQARAIGEALSEAHGLVRDGYLPAAEKVLRTILAVDPAHTESLHQLGLVLRDQERPDEAIAVLAAAAKTSRDAAILNDLGMILGAVGRGEDALKVYAAALAIADGEPAILTNRGKTLALLGRLDEALASHDMALARAPNHVNALYNRGNVLLALKRHAEAVASYDRALAIKPDLGPAFSNRGNANQALGLNREALSDYERAHALMPDDNQVGCNLGLALHNLNRDQDALRAYADVLGRNPAAAAAHYNAAIALLRQGDFKRGWREYEWRWRCAFFQPMVRELPAPLWLGAEDLAGRRILLHGEQGFGDMIQFLRYVPLVKQRGATVILDVPPELASLARSVSGVDEFTVPGQPLPGFDLHCPLLSLPHAFGTEIDSIPASIPYLEAAPERSAKWDERLRAMARPCIGLVWSGRSTHVNDLHRSLAFEVLKPLFDACQGSFVSLQIEIRDSDQPAVAAQPRLLSLGAELADFADTAATIAALDLVITIDTSVAHLAGALGKPVWIMLPWSADFRWLHDRDDSPWYPRARLFRQPAPGDWTNVIAQIARELSARFG